MAPRKTALGECGLLAFREIQVYVWELPAQALPRLRPELHDKCCVLIERLENSLV